MDILRGSLESANAGKLCGKFDLDIVCDGDAPLKLSQTITVDIFRWVSNE